MIPYIVMLLEVGAFSGVTALAHGGFLKSVFASITCSTRDPHLAGGGAHH
jgi:hypothetical protein